MGTEARPLLLEVEAGVRGWMRSEGWGGKHSPGLAGDEEGDVRDQSPREAGEDAW